MVMNAIPFLCVCVGGRGGGGWGNKQVALLGLGEIVNFSFLELLSHRTPVSKALPWMV